MGDSEGNRLVKLTAYLCSISSTPTEELLRTVIQLGLDLIKAVEGSILLRDYETGVLVFRYVVASKKTIKKLLGQQVPPGEGVVGLALATGEAQTSAPRFHGVRQVAGEPTAVLAVPLRVQGKIIGVMTAVSFEKERFFSLDDMSKYERFANVCAIIIEQHRHQQNILSILEGKHHVADQDLEAGHIIGHSDTIEDIRLRRLVANLVVLAEKHPNALSEFIVFSESLVRLIDKAGNS